jgi:hypothetical protein
MMFMGPSLVKGKWGRRPLELEPPRFQFKLLIDACIIAVILGAGYLLTFSGAFRVDDEHILAARAQSLAWHGSLEFPQVYGNDRVRHLSRVPQDEATSVAAIEPGHAFLGAALYRLAAFANLGGAQAFFVLNIYATALTGSLVYLMVRFLGFRRRTALGSAFFYGFGSMAWPYSKTLFRDSLAALMVCWAFLGWILLNRRDRLGRGLGVGLIAAGITGGLLMKSTVLLMVPALLIGALVLREGDQRRSDEIRKWAVVATILFGLMIISILLPEKGAFARYSLSHYLELGKRYWSRLSLGTLLAAMGPFISPTKSIFLFSPILLLAPVALIHFRTQEDPFTLPALLAVCFLSIGQALHLNQEWAGTLFWGLRFMLPAIPLLIVLAAPMLEKAFTDRGWTRNVIFYVLAPLSLFVQIAGAVVAWDVPFPEWLSRGLNPYDLKSVWDFRYLVIPYHWHHLADLSSWDIAWVRLLPTRPEVALIPITSCLLMVLGLFWLRCANRIRQPITSLSIALMLVSGILFPIYPSLVLLREDPRAGGGRPELRALVRWVQEQARPGDYVVVDSYGTKLWQVMMNDWDAQVNWLSLPFEIPGAAGVGWQVGGEPASGSLALFEEAERRAARLIYLTSSDSPDFGLERELRWLGENRRLLEAVQFEEELIGEVYIFR